MEFEEVDYWKELCRDHGLDADTHVTSTIISVLGCTGRHLPSLWIKETQAGQKNVWTFLAQSTEP